VKTVPGTLETDSESVHETFSGVPGTDTSVPEHYHERLKSETVPGTDTLVKRANQIDRFWRVMYFTNQLV